MRCFRWHISTYTNKIKLHRPRHCKNKRQQIFSYSYGGLVSRTSRELRAITMAFSLPAFQQPIRSRIWSAKNLADPDQKSLKNSGRPILASDDIREHMGEAKNGPDRRLFCWHFWMKWFRFLIAVSFALAINEYSSAMHITDPVISGEGASYTEISRWTQTDQMANEATCRP